MEPGVVMLLTETVPADETVAEALELAEGPRSTTCVAC